LKNVFCKLSFKNSRVKNGVLIFDELSRISKYRRIKNSKKVNTQ
jgi:hypothetical protein